MLHVDIQQSMEWGATVNPDFMSEVTEFQIGQTIWLLSSNYKVLQALLKASLAKPRHDRCGKHQAYLVFKWVKRNINYYEKENSTEL